MRDVKNYITSRNFSIDNVDGKFVHFQLGVNFFVIQSNLPKRPPTINDHFYSPRRFILYILTGFNDHLHNATNDYQNAFPNDHFNFFQRPLTLLHDELTTKMRKLTGCSTTVTFIFRMRKPEVIFVVPKKMFSLLLSFLIKNMFIFFLIFLPFGIFVRV